MKHFPIYTGICFLVTFFSLFLPYEQHDRYAGGLFSAPYRTETGIQTIGFDIEMAYIPLVVFVIISFVVLIRRNLATGIIGLIIGIFFILFMAVMGFGLTFHLSIFGGPRNFQLQIGYYLALIAVLSYAVMLLLNLIAIIRNRRAVAEEVKHENIDILDSF